MAQDAEQSAATVARATAPELEVINLVVLASAVFMAIWVLAVPGSWWVGSSPEHDAWARGVYEEYASFFAPSSIVFKYNVLGQLVGWTHALPGVVWCMLAPLQLNPQVRQAAGGALHRVLGRAMLAAATVVMLGYAIIDTNNLYADAVDFAGHGGGLADAADALNASQLGQLLPPFNLGGVRVVALWFVLTGVQAWLSAGQAPKDASAHREWALRHVASGVWVAAQRPLFAAVRLAQGLFLTGGVAVAPETMADAFYYSAYFVTALYIGVAEWAIRQDARPK